MNDRSYIWKALPAAFTLSVSCALLAPPAFATNSGIDTPTGVMSLPLSVQGVQIMTLTETGVGIGTTAPQAPLDVNGGMRGSDASSIKAGSTCSPEGMLGYDLTNHEPVYCSQSGQWTSSLSKAGQVIYQYDAACHTNATGGYEAVTTATITPGSASDNVLIHVDTNTNGNYNSGETTRFSFARTTGGSTIYFWQSPGYFTDAQWPTNNAYVGNSFTYENVPVSFTYIDSPNTTSPVTYYLEYLGISGQAFVNCRPSDGSIYSNTQMTLTEVLP